MASVADPVRAPKTSELVADRIRRRIVRGELDAGDSLPSEAELMMEFGVSRPSMREAFRLLEAEQLIEIRRGSRGGARVKTPTASVAARIAGLILQMRGTTVGDVYRARQVIEPVAAGQLAASASKAAIEALEAALSTEEAVLDDPAEFARRSTDFHSAIMQHCGNEALHLCYEILLGITQRTLDAVAQAPPTDKDGAVTAFRSQRRLVRLVKDGEEAKARQHWERHLAAAGEPLLRGRASRKVLDLFD